MKKIASLLLVLVMVLSLTVTAFAAPTETNLLGSTLVTGSITVTSNTNTGATVNGRSFVAVRILNATVSGDKNENIVYAIPDGMEGFYKDYFKVDDATLTAANQTLDEYVFAQLSVYADNAQELFDFGAAAYDWYLKNPGVLDDHFKTGANDVVKFEGLPMGYYMVVDNTTIYDGNGNLVNPAIPALSAVILQTPGENVSIAVKIDAPPIEKMIDGAIDTDPATTTVVPFNNTSIGDKVPYVVTSKIPNMTPFGDEYIFIVRDTMSKGLTYNNDLVITITDNNNNNKVYTLVKDQHYKTTVTTDATTGETLLVVEFIDFHEWHMGAVAHPEGTYWLLTNGTTTATAPDAAAAQALADYAKDASGNYIKAINTANANGWPIELRYTATVNEDAVIGIAGNPNAVTLEYTRDHKNTQLTTVTTEKVTKTFTTGIQLLKTDEDANPLAGASFKITGTRINTTLVSGTEYLPNASGTYWKLISGRYTETKPTTETESIYSTDVWYELKDGSFTQTSPVGLGTAQQNNYVHPDGSIKINKYAMTTFTDRPVQTSQQVAAEAFVNDQGILVFKGLGATASGEYYIIEEVISPAGFNALKEPIYVQINFTQPTDSTDAVWSGSYQLSRTGEGLNWSNLVFNNSTGMLEFSVENHSGTELPMTGGMGTTVLYVLGSIMVLGAAVLLITKRRVNA